MRKSVLTLTVVFVFFIIPKILLAQENSLMLGPADCEAEKAEPYEIGMHSLNPLSGATQRLFYIPIHLPEDVRIKRVTVYYVDEHDTSDLYIDLYRCNKYTFGADALCNWNSSGNTSGRQEHTILTSWTYNRVKNGGYHYFVRVIFSGTSTNEVRFYGAKIIYQ